MIGAGLSLATIATRRRGANQAPPGAPIPTAAPSISGTPTRGQTLTVSNGTWTNNPTGYAYQWRRGGAAVAGATTQTYELAAADVGANVSCTVTASNAAGSNYANAAAVGPIAAPAAPTVFRDGFDRPNDTGLHDGSASWTLASGLAGLRVENNQLRSLANEGAFLSPDLGSANHATQLLILAAAANVGPFITCRLVDQNNFGAGVRFNTSSGAIQLWKREGGALTMTGSATGAAVGKTLRVEVFGDMAQVLLDGVVVIAPTAMGGAGAGVTRQGLVSRTNAANPLGDNYEAAVITALAA